MSDLHIEEFYHDIGLILSRLYGSFPRKCTLYVEDISGEDTTDEFGMHSQRHLGCFGTMVWMKEEGYINFFSTVKQEAIDEAVLTEKSFLLLTSQANVVIGDDPETTHLTPFMAKKAITNINTLRRALQSKSSIKISTIVSNMMEQSYQMKR